jgi:hypothetical protein
MMWQPLQCGKISEPEMETAAFTIFSLAREELVCAGILHGSGRPLSRPERVREAYPIHIKDEFAAECI